jgi:hypothetical protein
VETRTDLGSKYILWNDKHKPIMLACLMLLVYMFLFSDFSNQLGIPSPRDLCISLGVDHFFRFSSYGVFEFKLLRNSSTAVSLYLFILIAGGIFFTYYSPAKYRRISQVFWSAVLFILVFDTKTLIFYLGSHFGIFYLFHRVDFSSNLILRRNERWIKFFSTQLPMLSMLVTSILNWLSGRSIFWPAGVILFFWQWQRLTIYYLDERDKLVPKSLTFSDYLAVFLSPATILFWDIVPFLAQGYAYLNERARLEERAKIVQGGAKFLMLALLYVFFGPIVLAILVDFGEILDIHLSVNVEDLVRRHFKGEDLSSLTILGSCLIAQIKWFVFIASISHIKVGLWRLLGYDVEAHFNKPWIATNLVNFWSRYTFHFRASLLRVFYYPVLLGLRGYSPKTRIVSATFASVGLGNMIWGHFPRAWLMYGMTFDALSNSATWIYYLLLSGGIVCTQLYLLSTRRTRRSWTRGWRVILDILAMAITVEYYSVIHIFARPIESGNMRGYFDLFLKGFGF